MPDDLTSKAEKLRQEIAALESKQRELRQRLEETTSVSQSGSGALATEGGTAAGEGGIAVGGNVFGNIYHVYQSPLGTKKLGKEDFARILNEYLTWVHKAYSTTRLWGLESLRTTQGPPVRDLAKVFVPLTLRRMQTPRREEVEKLAEDMQADMARAYLCLAEAMQSEGEIVPQHKMLTLKESVAIVGGAGSEKSTILSYLAASLAEAALKGEELPLELPKGKSTLVPLVIPLRYLREYLRLCKESPREVLVGPRVGTLAGFRIFSQAD